MKNNLAQAIEILDALIRCAGICRELAKGEGDSKPVPFEVRAGTGVGMSAMGRVGPGADDAGNPVYSFNVVFCSAAFEEDGRIAQVLRHASATP